MRMFFSAFVLAAVLVTPSPASAELKLTMDGGLVTIVAKDVPLSMIMAEWAKVGRTNILNGDKILTPVTIHLEGIPERKALDILLRAAAGYMLAERVTPVAGASTFDRIMILPTSRPPANAPPLQQQSPQPFAPPRPMPMPVQVQPDEEEPRPGNTAPNPAQMQPGMPQPGMQQPGAPNTPQAPLTSPRPGMLQPPPQQPVPFGTPRPPGGGGTPANPAGGGTPTNPAGGGGGGGL